MTENTHKMRKRRGGRRAMLPEERRLYSIRPGFNEKEITELVSRAEAIGLAPVEFVRRLVIGQSIRSVPSINKEALIELGRVGNNLNQIARNMNAGREDVNHTGLHSELIELRNLLKSVTHLLWTGETYGDM